MPSFKVTTKIKMDTKGLTSFGNKLKRQKDMINEVGHFDGKQHFIGTANETIAGVSLINQQRNTHSPARPYMVKALESPVFSKAWNDAAIKIAKGQSTIARELPKLGRLLRDVMMGVIVVAGPGFARNSRATTEKKGRDQPLIDTATLVNDIESRMIRDVSRAKRKGLNKALL